MPPVLQPFASASAKSWSREIDDEHVHICDKELISGVFLRTLCVYDGLTFSPESVKMQCFSVCCFFLHVSGICCCWKTRRERGGGEGGRGRGMGRRKKECRSKNVKISLPSIYLSIYLPICLPAHLSVCLPACLSIYLSIGRSVGLGVSVSFCVSVYLHSIIIPMIIRIVICWI